MQAINLSKIYLQDILGDNGVVICPTFIDGPHYPYEIYPRVCNVTYMMIFNAIGLPVTQCPIGLNKNGLPIGFQVILFKNNYLKKFLNKITTIKYFYI